MMEKKINTRINNIRALAILIVIFGHSIILYSSAWSIYEPILECILLDDIKKVINLIQMPLFFSLSGFLFAESSKEIKISAFVLKKFKRLMIPFYAVGIMWMIPIKKILNYSEYRGIGIGRAFYNLCMNIESGHLWYLPTLFLTFVIFVFWKKYVKGGEFLLFVITLIINYFRMNMPDFGIPFLENVYLYSWSFVLGMVFSSGKKYNFLVKVYKVIFSKKYLYFGASLIIAIVDTVVVGRADIWCSIILICGIYLCVSNQYNQILDSISKNSFGMYLIHSPLIYITFTFFKNSSPIVVVFLNLVVWGSVSYILTILIKKVKLGIIGEK